MLQLYSCTTITLERIFGGHNFWLLNWVPKTWTKRRSAFQLRGFDFETTRLEPLLYRVCLRCSLIIDGRIKLIGTLFEFVFSWLVIHHRRSTIKLAVWVYIWRTTQKHVLINPRISKIWIRQLVRKSVYFIKCWWKLLWRATPQKVNSIVVILVLIEIAFRNIRGGICCSYVL